MALTGSIASGKSAVAAEWARLGAAIVDADELARAVVEPGTPGLRAIGEAFGPGVIRADGTLDRAALRHIVFEDVRRRTELERILHPEIAKLRDARESALAAAGVKVVVHMIPLLFETGLDAGFDAIVLVDAPEPVRLERLVRDRGLGAAEARAMIAAQMPASTKRERLAASTAVTVLIENGGTMDQLEERAREAWRTIEQAARRR